MSEITFGEKLAWFRRQKNMTQEKLAELAGVSRQSVSRWEMDLAFPETGKLILLSRLLGCSIDYLLNEGSCNVWKDTGLPANECCAFIRRCGLFFLATSVHDTPKIRPMGMIYSDGKMLYLATDKRKRVCADLAENSRIELAAYDSQSGKWIRICGQARPESQMAVKKEMAEIYPQLRQQYQGENEAFLVLYRIQMEDVSLQ